jgi:hypothetical protein
MTPSSAEKDARTTLAYLAELSERSGGHGRLRDAIALVRSAVWDELERDIPPEVALRKRKLTSSEKRMRDLSGIEVYEVTRILPPGSGRT